ncbi:MAG: vitamin B12 dependent methionine synthase [Clostridia bacterium]|nr:vitamin B12 dependent methionine synthase [Clostridia bacterium]
MEIRNTENGFIIAEAPGITLGEKAAEQLTGLSAGCDDEMSEMLSEAAPLAVPKAIFTVAEVLHTAPDAVRINGVDVVSSLMSKNFSGLSRAFPYICTVGTELERWSEKYSDDPLASYWADEIKKAYLYAFVPLFRGAVAERYGVKGRFPSMNPGSLEKEWPISGQEQLFAMLGGKESVKERIGVTLTDSYLMLPSKTVSGICFESEHDYENCMLCPRVSCPNRRAPFDASKIG